MNVTFDARWIFREITGVGAVTRELLRHLAHLDDTHSYTVLFDDPEVRDRTWEETGAGENPAFRNHMVSTGVYSLRNQLETPGLLRSLGTDIYHATNAIVPLLAFPRDRRGDIACVATVHDVIPLKLPEFGRRSLKSRLRPLFRGMLREVGRRADAIVTDSEASRADTIEHLGIPPGRAGLVHAVHCGVTSSFRPAEPSDTGEPYILYVGRSDPYKNLTGLVRAFAASLARNPSPLRLRIVGPRDPRYPEPENLARELGIADRVDWVGYLADKPLLESYQGASLLALPSRYEGFGLPVLEAMACGTPVLCSAAGGLAEVAGDAAVLCDPDDIEGMAAAIDRILGDPQLRSSLRERGIAQAAQFSWENTCRKVLGLYASLGKRE